MTPATLQGGPMTRRVGVLRCVHPSPDAVILSEAKDLRSQHDHIFTAKHDHVRAQHRCAPASPGVNFDHAPSLTLSLPF